MTTPDGNRGAAVTCAGVAAVVAFVGGFIVAAMLRDRSPIYYSTGTFVAAGAISALVAGLLTGLLVEKVFRRASESVRRSLLVFGYLASATALCLFTALFIY